MKQRVSRAIVILLVCVVCVPLWSQQSNPANPAGFDITNGGFEQLNPDGTPVDWEYVGGKVEVSNDAHSGKHSLRLVRTADMKDETGLNRRWKPDSGEQGAMLAQLKGGLRFWYKAVSARNAQLTIFAIPMSSRPMEDTGSPRASFVVPSEHVGDGQWHEGKLRYDFTKDEKAKWVHVSPRIVGEAGEVLLDDFEYVEKVGPILALPQFSVRESDAKPGREAVVTAVVENAGDEPIDHLSVSLQTPPELTATPGDVVLSRLALDERHKVTWTVSGDRSPGMTLRVRATSGNLVASAVTSLSPDVSLVWFLADRFLLSPGATTKLTVRLQNANSQSSRGLATAKGVQAKIITKGEVTVVGDAGKVLPDIAPGSAAETEWQVRVGKRTGEESVHVEIDAGAKLPLRGESKLQVSSAVQAAAKQFAGPLWYRADASGTIAELRIGKTDPDIVAVLPHLGRVLFRNSKGVTEEVRARVESTPRKQGDSLEAVSRVKDREGGEWTFTISVSTLDPARLRLRISAACNQPRQVLAFEGPMLCALEGSQERRDEAMLGGLEWLVDDEASSSALDIAENHTDRIRYVPHPNKITIPFASIHNQRGTFGLLWDVHQKWDGQADRPQPAFASPDRFEGRRGHLMGLMAPNVVTGLTENERLAKSPIQLAANKRLSLEATLYADPNGKDALAAMDAWFLTYHPDSILPPPKGDYARQVEFSMRAYLESLYLPKEKAWWPFLGGPAIWRKSHHSPNYAYDLLMAARITKDPNLASRYRARAEEQLAADVPQGGRPAKPVGDDLGLDAGGVESQLLNLGLTARSLSASMGQDGAWRFNANLEDQGVFKGMDYHELGKDKAAELGTCAQQAYQILRYARMSGDVEMYRAGVKSLEFMKQFHVPRAAQVWEVPVHSPDILAAADAIDAYLEAYRFSGDKQWLAEAQRWARAGLPFVYVWNDPRYPWMRYGSIPVMGASWMQCSWYGVLVQWNGLRYAYALLKLSEYDSSSDRGYTWKDIAIGLTHSAMYQQSEGEKNVALWPDSYNTMTGGRANWDFPPRQILKNVYSLIRREPEPRTVILGQGETRSGHEVPQPISQSEPRARLYFTSRADILTAAWQGDRLEATLQYPPQEQGLSLLVGLKRPRKVTIDGKEVSELKDLEDATGAGWRFDERYNCLLIKTDHDGKTVLAVEGVTASWKPFAPRIVNRIDFTFDRDPDGWIEAHDLTPFEIRDGALLTRATGGDPYMIRGACHVNGDSVKAIVVRMRVSAGAIGQFYWTTEASPFFAEDKVAVFNLIADGQFHEYRVPVGDHSLWRGQTITGIRLDPTNNAPEAEVGVAFVRGE